MRRIGLHLFEGGRILEQAYQYLLSIPPTSIEAERAFSAAGYIGNKIRSQLGDDTIRCFAISSCTFPKRFIMV